jgi:hypothetical protein
MVSRKGILRVEILKLVSALVIADALIYSIFTRMVGAGRIQRRDLLPRRR